MEDNKKEINKTQYVMIALVGILLLFSIVQTYQISNLVDDGTIGYATKETITANQIIKNAAPQVAPTMVGGC